MSVVLTLDLPPELESELSQEAARLNLSVSEYALYLLKSRPSVGTLQSGGDLVAYWEREGVIGSRPDIEDSQAHARRVRREAESRTRE